MSDRLVFSGLALIAVLMIALALVWPQGFGARSPAPFGHAVTRQDAGPKRKGPDPSILPIPPRQAPPAPAATQDTPKAPQ